MNNSSLESCVRLIITDRLVGIEKLASDKQ